MIVFKIKIVSQVLQALKYIALTFIFAHNLIIYTYIYTYVTEITVSNVIFSSNSTTKIGYSENK